MVKKSDWKTLDMPSETERFSMEMGLIESEIEKLKLGHLPQEMEDKWFIYFENQKLYIHRSWTGICIYIVSNLQAQAVFEVTVNRNPEQYQETNVQKDKIMINILLNQLMDRNGENAELMNQYIKMK